MSIIGFQLTKLAGNRSEFSGRLQVTHNIQIQSVKAKDVQFTTDAQTALQVDFLFEQSFEPKAGKIEIEGFTVVLTEKAKADTILAEWEKKKSVSQDVLSEVMHYVYNKSLTHSIILAKEIGLPCPIPFPKLDVKKP
ncbi:MAG: hypothetical protein ACMXYA_01415 [Candidatus Woesearchaeota archaeon]